MSLISAQNPFRRSQSLAKLGYNLDGQHYEITGDTYANYQAVFKGSSTDAHKIPGKFSTFPIRNRLTINVS